MERPILSLAEMDAYDPQGPLGRKWCPLCGEGKPKDAAHRCLSIERSSGLWKCFRCGQSGQAREFWPDKPFTPRQITRRQVGQQKLRSAFALEMPPQSTPTVDQAEACVESGVLARPLKATASPTEPSGAAKADWRARWEATHPLEGSPGAKYLAGRGIGRDVAQWANVRWSGNWSGHGAVVFPIHNRQGDIIAAQGRAVVGNAKLTAGSKKEGAFFAPVELASQRRFGPLDHAVSAIVLVEAPIDALSLAACGFPALALCGTSGPPWLHLACGLRRVVLAFDADEAGDRASGETALMLKPYGARCSRLRPPDFKDWNDWLVGGGVENMRDFLDSHLL